MPELPEIEIVKQSLDKKVKFEKIKKVVVRNRSLRFKIPKNFEIILKNKIIISCWYLFGTSFFPRYIFMIF